MITLHDKPSVMKGVGRIGIDFISFWLADRLDHELSLLLLTMTTLVLSPAKHVV